MVRRIYTCQACGHEIFSLLAGRSVLRGQERRS